jgi:medium-chain acyl-[acyl-carrier-protein] hydrolase
MSERHKGEQDALWREAVEIHSYDVDIERQMTIESLLKYCQEAAWNHAEHLGVGYSHLRARGQVWMLSRLTLAVDSYPEWGQQTELHTWPRGVKSLFALRDFELLDINGHSLAGATSSWLVFDQEARRPLRPESILASIPTLPDRRALSCDAEKLTVTEIPLSSSIINVKYSDLDLNDHVNNAAYARWILDRYPVEFHRRHRLRKLTINFLAALDGQDSVLLGTAETGALRFAHAMRRQADHGECCRAEIVWSPSQ